ncbi:hypothetical protein RUM43_012163 [Polyplax serrata]|uniref:Uncharacterized protein n=1 Tax=Polyplax serrata TaxID=468196 RepID=A0AAN8S7A8_POLSC
MLKQTRRLIIGLGTTVNLGGTEQFASMRDLYIKNGQGFVVVYSLTNHQTFQDIKTMKELITRVKGTERVPILLVANKVDLEHQREVSEHLTQLVELYFFSTARRKYMLAGDSKSCTTGTGTNPSRLVCSTVV